jgi:hypothetical protein
MQGDQTDLSEELVMMPLIGTYAGDPHTLGNFRLTPSSPSSFDRTIAATLTGALAATSTTCSLSSSFIRSIEPQHPDSPTGTSRGQIGLVPDRLGLQRPPEQGYTERVPVVCRCL